MSAADGGLPSPLDRPLAVTFFYTAGAWEKDEYIVTLRDLAPHIKKANKSKKQLLPWLKLAQFGDVRKPNDKNPPDKWSFRHNENVLAITGIEADYDDGVTSIFDALAILRASNLAGVVYSSPSHTEDAPRWRVLCPLSEDYPPSDRTRFLERLNGIFAGSLSGESFTLSQSYYFGSVKGNPSHCVETIEGDYLDLRSDLDAGAIGKPKTEYRPIDAPQPDRRADKSRYVEAVIKNALSKLSRAPDGQKHYVLREQSKLIGGFLHVGSFTIDEMAAVMVGALPNSVVDRKAALSTAKSGLELGATLPLDIPDLPPRPTQTSEPNGHTTITPEEWEAIELDKPEQYINGHADDAPLPNGEGEYGQISPRNGGAPIIEILPPEFADDSLALNFSDTYGEHLRYVDAWSRWFRWTGQVWKHDDTLMVYDLCRRTCRSFAINAAPAIQKAITSGKTIASVEKLVRSDRRHAATVDQWDNDPWLLNTPSGIINLQTREVIPHDPLHHMTKCTSVGPDAESGCPLWLRFLDRVTNGDVLLQAFLQRVCGYCLTGITRDHAMFFAYGTGRNGKGVFLNTIVSIMGDYARTADPDTFTAAGAGKHLTVLARLQGARLVVAQETEEGVPWAEARIKALTGGDKITANYMRQDPFEYIPQFKLFMAGNHKPGLKAVDEAIKGRFNLIPFEVTISLSERDDKLTEKLAAERGAILQWMIDGCWDWQQVKLKAPPVVANATGEYFNDEDAIGMWISEACEVRPSAEYSSGELFKSWVKWAQASGETPHSQKRFTQSLASRGFPTRKGTGGARLIKGLLIPTARPNHETETDRE